MAKYLNKISQNKDMKSKKGFLVSQMFIYAFGIIVAILILYSGYKAIFTFSSSAETSTFTTLQAKLSSDLESLALHKGEVKTFSYSIPYGYNQVCAFDLINDSNLQASIFEFFPFLRQSIEEKSENIFFINNNKVFGIRVPALKIKGYPYYACVNLKGNELTFNAKGDVYNGERVAMLLTSNKVEVDLSLPYLHDSCTNLNSQCHKLKSNLEIISSDGLAKMIILKDTEVTLPVGNKSLYIKINGAGRGSNEYDWGPAGTKFTNNLIKLGIKKSDCESNVPFKLKDKDENYISTVTCEEGFAIWTFSEI